MYVYIYIHIHTCIHTHTLIIILFIHIMQNRSKYLPSTSLVPPTNAYTSRYLQAPAGYK